MMMQTQGVLDRFADHPDFRRQRLSKCAYNAHSRRKRYTTHSRPITMKHTVYLGVLLAFSASAVLAQPGDRSPTGCPGLCEQDAEGKCVESMPSCLRRS